MALGTVDLSAFAPVGTHTSNSSLGSVVALTPPPGADQLLIQALTQNVRFTLDGTAPTSSLGFMLKAGDSPVLIPIGATGQVIKVIEETAGGIIQYQWGF
jgi:hypothetical protein